MLLIKDIILHSGMNLTLVICSENIGVCKGKQGMMGNGSLSGKGHEGYSTVVLAGGGMTNTKNVWEKYMVS